MIRVDMTAPELDRQIELLKVYPEILEKHFVPVLKRDVKLLEARIKPTIPVLSGRAQRTFGSRVTGKGIYLTGQVGWYDRKDPWYPNVIEHGARPHALNKGASTRSKKRQSIFSKFFSDPNRVHIAGAPVKIGDRWVTMEKHPGLSKRGFMEAGYKSMQPSILADLAKANEGVVKDLALD
jgi:hypothetical protein